MYVVLTFTVKVDVGMIQPSHEDTMKRGHTYQRKLSEQDKVEAVAMYNNGSSITETAERFAVDRSSIWSLLKRRGVIMRPHCIANRRCTLDESAFDTVTDESAYWVAFIMADGNISHREYSTYVSVTQNIDDAGHLDTLRDFLGSNHKITTNKNGGSYPNARPSKTLNIASERLASALGKFGVVADKSMTCKVIGLENNRHFWRGLMDGDGAIFVTMNRHRPKAHAGMVGSKAMAEQFSAYVKTVVSCAASVKPVNSIWGVTITSQPAVDLLVHLYGDGLLAMPRKVREAKEAIEAHRFFKEQKAARMVCTVPDCGSKVEALGFCLKHYKRFRKHGDPALIATRWSGPAPE